MRIDDIEGVIFDRHPNPAEMSFCPDCGWRGTYGEMKHALFIYPNSNINAGLRVKAGGDGMNYRCLKCNNRLMAVRYPKDKIIV